MQVRIYGHHSTMSGQNTKEFANVLKSKLIVDTENTKRNHYKI